MNGVLPKYDWLHLHHEDFTGQYGKFYVQYSPMPGTLNNKKKPRILPESMVSIRCLN
jgi:hypothetical protein